MIRSISVVFMDVCMLSGHFALCGGSWRDNASQKRPWSFVDTALFCSSSTRCNVATHSKYVLRCKLARGGDKLSKVVQSDGLCARAHFSNARGFHFMAMVYYTMENIFRAVGAFRSRNYQNLLSVPAYRRCVHFGPTKAIALAYGTQTLLLIKKMPLEVSKGVQSITSQTRPYPPMARSSERTPKPSTRCAFSRRASLLLPPRVQAQLPELSH